MKRPSSCSVSACPPASFHAASISASVPTIWRWRSERDRRLLHQPVELLLLGRRLVLDVLQVLAGGDQAEAGIVGGQALQERLEGLILEPPGLGIVHRILQRLDAVEDEQRAMPPDERGQPFTAFPRAAFGGVGVVEKRESFLDEQVGRGLPRFARALAVERPVEVALDARPALLRHPLADPVRHQRRLADAAPGNQRVDIQCRVRPGRIKRVEPAVAAEEDCRRMPDDARRGELDLVTASLTKLDDIAAVEAGRQLAVVDPNRDDALALFPRELHLAIDPVRRHRSMRQDHDKGIALADAFLDPVPEELVGCDGVAVIEDVVVAKRLEKLHDLLHIAVIRAAMADKGAGHGVHPCRLRPCRGATRTPGNRTNHDTECFAVRAKLIGQHGRDCARIGYIDLLRL